MRSSNDIRQQFIDFFVQKHGHTAVPSASVVPLDDPTLLFTNAGMNQFKDVFLGTGTRPYKRAVDSQKCIRAGGKHNDLEDVGRDTYHHTFFEMLGNWSFGDYFKKEAIAWAWELLTSKEWWGLDKSRLHATVFEGDPAQGLARDDEAFEFWKTQTDIDPSHIHYGGKKDNFWEMGETGPCGPCSEIHYDRTPDKSGGILVNKGDARVIEIWNLVFIQFNRDEKGTLHPLPARHVDTGMGFERITAVLKGKESNYDTDVFSPLMAAIGDVVHKQYGGRLDNLDDVAFRVIADHLRMLTFAITDGALPGNKGRGAVLRSVLRRAFRFGYQRFGRREPFVFKLVPALVEHMGGAYPELRANPGRVQSIISCEEADFLRTIERGLSLFEDAADRATQTKKHIRGKDVFDLHTTYGFPPDLTRQMAQERQLSLDEDEYQRLMEVHRSISDEDRKKFTVTAISGKLPKTDDSPKYAGYSVDANVLGWIRDNVVVTSGRLNQGEEGAVLLDRTSFYAEQGGQIGDVGVLSWETGEFEVTDTQRLGEAVLHIGMVTQGYLSCGQAISADVSMKRINTMRNHTATHLLNWALRKVLGGEIDQKGSLVDPDKTRFDFTHDKPMSTGQIEAVERLVNERIYGDLPVIAATMPLAQAKQIPGVRAVFGEKYPDPVRVLMIGVQRPEDATDRESVEFCGGTHLEHTGQIGFFKIISQEAVGKGVRRVTAVTGRKAVETVQNMASVIDALTARFRCQPEELAQRIDTLQDEIKKLQQQLRKGAAGDLQGAVDRLLSDAVRLDGTAVVVGEVPAGPDEAVRQQVDRMRQKAGTSVIVLGWADEGKVQLIAAVTDDLVKKGLHAGKLIGQVAKIVGGGGGGKPTLAQAGGKDPGKLPEALETAKKLVTEMLGR